MENYKYSSIYGQQSSDYRIYGVSGRLNSEVYSISKWSDNVF